MRTPIEAGQPCNATGGKIKMITARVCQFVYGDVKYNFFNHNGEQVDLQNGKIDFDKFVGKTCNIYGDFLSPKTTKTGKVKHKFLVLRIQQEVQKNGN